MKKTKGPKKINNRNTTESSSDNEVRAARKLTSIDDRQSQRIPIQLLVDYRSNGNYLFDFCRDLGAGGVFIETKTPLPHGSQVHLTFTLPDSKETLRAEGKVIWVQDQIKDRADLTPGMGVQFSDFSKTDRKKLEDFLNRTGKQLNTAGKPTQKSA